MTSHPVLVELGHRLRVARDDLGMDQGQVAYEVGCDRTYVILIERAKRNPTVLMLVRFARVLDVDPAQLMAGLHDIEAEAV